MALTVAELLALPVLARARPEIVHGSDLDRREVRWVHTSEIYDISPLLKGGEVLLTTGLGLVAGGRGSLRNYVAALAERQVSALFLELGRTFPEVPPELAEAARDADLPLVVLHGVVPFIEVTETVHSMLLSSEVDLLRLTDRLTSALMERMLDGAGLDVLVATVAELAGCPTSLTARDGAPIASAAGPGHPSSGNGFDGGGMAGQPWPAQAGGAPDEPGPTQAGDAPAGDDPASLTVPVEVSGETWGLLTLSGTPTALRRTLADRAASILALEVLHSGTSVPARRQARAALLRDIVAGRYSSSIELTSRAASLGLFTNPGRRVLAICLAVDAGTPVRIGVTAATEAARRVFGSAMVTDVEGDVIVAATTDAHDLRGALARFADATDAELRATTGGQVSAVTAGPLTDDFAGLVGAIPAAREASSLARRMMPSARVLLAADLGMYRLLSRATTDTELEHFVQEQLGPLLRHDAAHGSALVRTLDAYLAAGLSKSAAAEALAIRRQSLYGRLDRITALLGGADLEDRQRRTALDLALVAWRLRTAAAGEDVGGSRPRGGSSAARR